MNLLEFGKKRKITRVVTNVLLASSLALSPLVSHAVHVMHTASTFAPFAEDARVGIEIEFTGLSLKDALKTVHDLSGGTIVKKEKRKKTTLKEITKDGMVYNEAVIPEWVIQNSDLGELTIKIDDNQVDDVTSLEPEKTVLELVTSPIKRQEVKKLQVILSALKQQGARGTADGEVVSIQYNTEVNKGDVASYNWQELVNLMRVYMNATHRIQIDEHLQIPDFRKEYIALYSPGFIEQISRKDYRPTARQLFDDFIYRQSLELLGFKDAWTMEISKAQQLLLSQKNPVVPRVVKQNKLRVSSLLAMAFPDDPMTKAYMESGWMVPMPVVEWREFNNDFDVLTHYKEVMGLTFMAKKYGAFNHDELMSQLSGVDKSTIAELRKKSFEQIKNLSASTVFRYFIGNPKTIDKSEFKDLIKAYEKHPVGFLPFYEKGLFPISIPGESVVMHRNQFHRFDVIGKYNVGLINGFIMQAIENKYVEMKFWKDYSSEGIPETLLVRDLGVGPIWPQKNSSEVINQVKENIKIFNKKFPQGWVLKGLFDLGSEKDILTDKTNLVSEIETYLKSDFDSFKTNLDKENEIQKKAEDAILEVLKEHKGYKGWKILKLLSNEKSVMIQERYIIAKEFRVEVVAGHVLGGESTVDRYEYAHKQNGKLDSDYPRATKQQIQKVEAYADRLMRSLPDDLKGMTFGLDVALTDKGETVLIESNPGGNSSFLYEVEPGSIKKLSNFLLKVPELAKKGELKSGLSPQAQMQYLERKFAKWEIDTNALYPGIKFLKDRIEDAEFKPRDSDKNKSRKGQDPGVIKGEFESGQRTPLVKCEAVFK